MKLSLILLIASLMAVVLSQRPAKPRLCYKTGCSSQICSDDLVMTTCEWLPIYYCYQQAECKRQKDGECGFTENEELKKCLEEGGRDGGVPVAPLK